jgi:RNA polymerase sigma factor (sigma-70 family)
MAVRDRERLTSDEQLVAEFARARDRGDRRRALAAWEQLAVNNYDRVAQLVKLFRFPGGGAISLDDRDDATQEAFLRVSAMADNFRGVSVGEFRAAVRSAVHNSCMDFGRPVLRHARHAAGSLDEPVAIAEETGRSRYEGAIARMSAEQAAVSEEEAEEEERRTAAHDLVVWGIAQVANEGYRAVLELTYVEKLSGEEIAKRLQISEDNVYQRRRRGLQKLEKILRDQRD